MSAMADYASLVVRVVADTKAVGPKIKADTEEAGAVAGEASGRSFGSKFSDAMMKALVVVGAAEVLSKVVEAAETAGKVTEATAAVIASTGGAAHVTAGQVSELADSIMRKTGIDHEAIQSGSNMLLTFRNVRDEAGRGNDIFDQATVALTNMTASMNGGNVTQENMRKTAIQLGKALNDPITGMTALRREGVTFTAAQTAQVKAMVAAGDTMGAQKIILGELTKEFGGAAEAYATPLKKLQASAKELEISLGAQLLPVLDSVATFLVTTGIPALASFGGWLGRNRQWVIPLVGALGTFVTTLYLTSKAFAVATAAAELFGVTLELSLGPVGLVILGLTALGVGLYLAWTKSETFRAIVTGAFNLVKNYALDVLGWFTRSFVPFWTVTLPHAFSVTVNWVRAFWTPIYGFLVNPIGSAAALINRYANNILNTLSVLAHFVTGPFVADWNWAWRTIINIFSHAGSALAGVGGELIHGLMAGISGAMSGMGGWLKRVVVDPIINGVKGFFGIHSPSTVMEGIGGNLVSGLLRGLAGNVSHIAATVFGGMPQALGAIVKKGFVTITQLPGKALSALGKVGGSIGHFFSGLFSSGGGGGSGVARWRPLMAQVLNMFGVPQLLGTFMTQMNTESGGNPNAINLWDSNAKAGTPSQGLMQVIPGTFAAYAGPFRSRGILDPLANIYAAVAYALSRYGSNIAGVLGHGHGYAAGGVLNEPVAGIGLHSGDPYQFGERGPEIWTPLRGAGSSDPAMRMTSTGGATVINVYPQAGQSETAIAASVDRNLAWAAAGGTS